MKGHTALDSFETRNIWTHIFCHCVPCLLPLLVQVDVEQLGECVDADVHASNSYQNPVSTAVYFMLASRNDRAGVDSMYTLGHHLPDRCWSKSLAQAGPSCYTMSSVIKVKTPGEEYSLVYCKRHSPRADRVGVFTRPANMHGVCYIAGSAKSSSSS